MTGLVWQSFVRDANVSQSDPGRLTPFQQCESKPMQNLVEHQNLHEKPRNGLTSGAERVTPKKTPVSTCISGVSI